MLRHQRFRELVLRDAELLFRLEADFFFADDRDLPVDFDDEALFALDFVFELVFVFDFDLVLAFEPAVDDFVFDRVFAFDVDFALAFDFDFALDFDFDFDFDFAPDVFAREADVFRAPVFRELPLRRVVRRSDPPSSSVSSSEPISFFATPTAAGIATPSAVPATTFCVVERPSSSSFDMLTSRAPALGLRARYLASLNASMNLGMIRSRRTSGPCCAAYLPAASAASSASGSSTSDAASQPVEAADERSPDPFFDFEPPSELPLPFERPWSSCDSFFRTAYVAAVVAAAAAAAVSADFPEPPDSFSCTFSTVSWTSAMGEPPYDDDDVWLFSREPLPDEDEDFFPPVISPRRDISVSLTLLNVCAALSACSLISSAIATSFPKSAPSFSSRRSSPTSDSRSSATCSTSLIDAIDPSSSFL
jgi:hypothetical protein